MPLTLILFAVGVSMAVTGEVKKKKTAMFVGIALAAFVALFWVMLITADRSL